MNCLDGSIIKVKDIAYSRVNIHVMGNVFFEQITGREGGALRKLKNPEKSLIPHKI